jgi:hypothetical protein
MYCTVRIELDQSILDKVVTIQKLPKKIKATLGIRWMDLFSMLKQGWRINNKSLRQLTEGFVRT